jgi:hypothetical protein
VSETGRCQKNGMCIYSCLNNGLPLFTMLLFDLIRRTNIDSCIMMKVERLLPDLPTKFQRLYFSLAAMKSNFLVSCRPIIGLDGCFLKGPHKGQLLAAISRNANNQIYPVTFAVVELPAKFYISKVACHLHLIM